MNITVGSSGNYTTLNEAIDYAKGQNEEVEIRLLSGYKMEEQVVFKNEDCSHITITTTSRRIPVVLKTFNEFSSNISYPEFDTLPAFYGYRSKLPLIDCHFQMEVDSDKYGCNACKERFGVGFHLDESEVYFEKEAGFTDSPFINLLLMNNSNARADYGKFDRGGNRNILGVDNIGEAYGDGVRVVNSTFTGTYATANRCGDIGFHFTQGARGTINYAESDDTGHHALMATTASIVSARYGKFTNCIDDGVVAYASSKIDLREGDASGAVINYGVIATRTSEINFESGKANNCGYSGIMANRGSTIDATNAKSNNCKVDGVRSANSSHVDFTNGEAIGSLNDGIHCTHGSTIQARLATITGSGRDNILAYSAEVYANEVTAEGAGRYNLNSTRGGMIACYNSNLDNAGVDGILCYGSEVFANNSSIRNAGGRAIEATQGGVVKAYNTNVSGALDWGYAVYNGGVIYAVGGNGEANRDINEQTGDGLIVM